MKPRLSAVYVVLALLVFASTQAGAQQKPFGPRLENWDRRAESAQGAAEARREKANGLAHLRRGLPNVRIDFDEVTGTPAFVHAPAGFLSGPGGIGRGIPAAAHAGLAANEPHRAAKAFLREHRELFGHGPEALTAARIKREFVTVHNGVRTVVWRQELDGLPVFGAQFIAHTTRNGELVSVASQFMTDPALAAGAGAANPAGLVAAPPVSAEQALARAADQLGEKVGADEVRPRGEGVPPENWRTFAADALRGEIHARLVWLPMNPKLLRLCWEVILTSRARGETFRVLIDAQTGDAQLRHSLTAYQSDAAYRVYTSDSPSPFSPGHPVPSTNQPPLVPRLLVVTNAINAVASPNGWINDSDNETRGNNVDAHTDADGDDQPDLPRPQGSPARVFDFPLDLTQPPGSYSSAAVVQLFYWNNWMHDQLYDLGFTEAAGNFQNDNFGRGGLGNDAVQADAQDGSGFNNANMTTLPDGIPPRMQMFLFTGPEPDRDGDFDAEVILHEYTHGLSNRRVGGGVGIFQLQTAGMGEGWSDFYGLALLSEPGDDVDGAYAAGGYLTYQFFGLLENYYFGIRRYPYSTDLSRNPLTFKDIDPTQASAHDGVPLSPLNSPFSAAFAPEVHNQGEVWCVTLWDARANLIKKHGFAMGHRLILQLVTDGMNFSPANPNFLQARDAILLADQVNNAGANLDELWAAFAKRGMGFSATSPSSSTTVGVRESFDPPDDLVVTPLEDFASAGFAGGAFSPGLQIFTLTNVGTNVVVWTASRSAGWLNVSPAAGTILPGGAAAQVTASLENAAAALPGGVYVDSIQFSNATTHVVQSRVATLQIGQSDAFTEWFQSGENDLDFRSFTFTPDGSDAFYSVCRQTATSFFTDPTGGTQVVLTDDSFAEVTLTGGETVAIYGSRSNVFFVGSNGYLTQEAGDTSRAESPATHFSRRRVSAMFDDLDPAEGGTVSWKQLSNRVAVTYLNVPEFLGFATNSFQVELFFDGRIRLTYLNVGSIDGLVGLSRGLGVPPGFAESDFSGYLGCGLLPLTVTMPASVIEGAGVLTGQGSIRFAAPVPANVTVTLSSSDTTEIVLPPSVVVPAGETNATFDVSVLDDTQLDGTHIVAVTASAPAYAPARARTQVLDNETATLSLALVAEGAEGSGAVTGRVSVSAVPDTGIAVGLVSSDTNELQVPAVVIIPAGATSVVFTAAIVDDTRLDGPQTVNVTAHVTGWTDGAASIVIQDNDPRTLTLLLPPRTREGRGVLTNAGVVRLAGTLSTNLTVALSSSDATELTVPPNVTVPAGESTAAFSPTAVDEAGVDGTQSSTVTASAPGFTNGAATIVVFDDETPLPPVFPNPPHLASNILVTANLAWSGGDYTELLVNGDFEAGNFDGWVRVAGSLGNFEINTATNDPPSPDGPLPPFEGNFSALAEQFGPGIHEMYQDVSLPSGAGRLLLSWVDRVRNHYVRFDADQQYRVEIRDTNNLVLAVAHTTLPGDPLLGGWLERSFDLTPFAGRTIRVAFRVSPGGFHLGVHVDNVSVALSEPDGTTYDVYFGTNPTPGPAEFLGSTTSTFWDLPTLAPATTYSWRILARTLGQIDGPIWQFTTRGVDHLEWGPIASPQVVGQPFNVSIVAKDAFNTTVSNFTGALHLSSLAGFTSESLFSEDFEDGNFDGWNIDGGDFVRAVTGDTAAGGASSLTLIGGDRQHRNGLSHTFANVRPEVVRFAVRAGRGDASGGYFVLGTGTNRSETAVFFYMEGGEGMGIYEDAGFRHQAPFVANRWYHVSLVFSWTNRTVDYYVDEALVEQGIPFRGTNVSHLSRLYLYNFDYTQSWWDEIDFITNNQPLRIAFTPTNAVNFTNGVWSGDLTLLQPAGSVTLHADDAHGHAGSSNPFEVVRLNDLIVRIDDSPDPATVGSEVVYRIGVTNTGPAPATGVVLTNTLPEGATLVTFSASPGNCAVVGNDIVCDIGSLPGGASAIVTVVTTPMRFGNLTSRASITRAEADADLSNNTATALTTVAPPLLTVGNATLLEGNGGQASAFFHVNLSSIGAQPVTISFSTSNGTATAGSDFVPASGTLFFPPGSTQQTIGVLVNGDALIEADETFTVLLNKPVNASVMTHAATGLILNDELPAPAAMPFVENWETGTIRPFWLLTGTGTFRSRVVSSNQPHAGSFHLTMVNAVNRGTNARNELTLYLDLQGWTNVILRFWAKGFGDGPDGPPPSPFIGGADFDGVAVSMDGAAWYEVQGLRNLASGYAEYVVNLDTAVAAHGLAYTRAFRIRFNQVDGFAIPINGIGIDDISITGDHPAILAAGSVLLAENCVVANQAIDPGETVTLMLMLRNMGLAPTADLKATLLAGGGVTEPSGTQVYGIVTNGGAAVGRPFTFNAGGVCGGTVRATLLLHDSGRNLGEVAFDLPLGASRSNTWSFAEATPIVFPSAGPGDPYPSSNVVSGVADSVRKVTVTLHDFTHSRPDDVDILLVGPLGQNVLLMSDSGGSFGVTNVTMTFDSTATTYLPDADRIVSGTYHPTNHSGIDAFFPPAPGPPFGGSLAVFNGRNPNGAWRLFTYDDGSQETGSIAGGWTLSFETDVVCCQDNAAVDLVLGMQDSPDPVTLEGEVVYTLQVTNRGPGTATGVVITDELPAVVTFVSATSPSGDCTYDSGVVSCAVGTLASGAIASATIAVRVSRSGSLTNAASVAANETELHPANNAAEAVTFVSPPVLTVQNVSASEGTGGAVFSLRLNSMPAQTVSISFATANLDALAGFDYVGTNGQVVFLPGETNKTVTVPVLADALDETNEVFALNVFNPVNASLNSPGATATIVDDDSGPTLSISDVTLAEGNTGTTQAAFNLRLSQPSGQPIRVNYATANGMAAAPADYVATNGTITFVPGQTNQPARVSVRGDVTNEVNETFFVNLTSPVNVTVADGQGLATILNDDFLPTIVLAFAVLSAEGCTPTNGVIDPEETISVTFTLRNTATGGAAAADLVATLLAVGGVTVPSAPQSYGVLGPGSLASRTFTFTASGNCGGSITAVLALRDGVTPLGMVTNVFQLGRRVQVFAENFDGVTAPNLPAGWTAALTGAGASWRTSVSARDSLPNAMFAPNPSTRSTNDLTSPPVFLSTTNTQLSFRHNFNTESNYDGGTLLFSVNGSPFVDVLTAGGRFVSGGYNGTIESGAAGWTGNSGGFVSALVNLPASAAGKNIRLRWRMTTDGVVGGSGWYVDTISVRDGSECCGPPPLRIEEIRLAAGLVILQWAAIPGRTYRVQFKPTIDAASWMDLPGDVTAAAQSAMKTDAPGAFEQRFYRVILVQ